MIIHLKDIAVMIQGLKHRTPQALNLTLTYGASIHLKYTAMMTGRSTMRVPSTICATRKERNISPARIAMSVHSMQAATFVKGLHAAEMNRVICRPEAAAFVKGLRASRPHVIRVMRSPDAQHRGLDRWAARDNHPYRMRSTVEPEP